MSSRNVTLVSLCNVLFFSFFPLSSAPVEVRERKMAKILVPLILGFKLAGAIVMGVALVKLFLVKALILSKVALLSAAFLLAKKLLSSLGAQSQQHPYLFAQQPIYQHHQQPLPPYPDPVHGYGYSAPGGAAALLGGDGDGVGVGVHEHLEDQHAQFSDHVSSALARPNFNNTARMDGQSITQTHTLSLHRLLYLAGTNLILS